MPAGPTAPAFPGRRPMTTIPAVDARAAFRSPDFRLYGAARLLWGAALQMQNVAVGWLIYDLTRSAWALGFAGLAAFLPAVLLAPVTGPVADAFDRRLVVLIAFVAATLAALGLLAAAGSGAVPALYALIVLQGAARAFAMPAMQALMPTLVPREDFGNAVAWNSSITQGSIVAGPALGGLLYALGPAVVFGSAALAFALGAGLIAAIRTRRAAAVREPVTWRSAVAGLTFIRTRPVLFGAISLDLFAVLLGGATALLPIYAQDVLHTGPWGLGALRSMQAVGAVCMGLYLAHHPLRRHAGRRMLVAVGVFGLATIAFGLSTNLFVSLACLLVVGAADMVSVFVRQTLVQADTPDEMRGRVAAVNTVFIGASNELGEFESGALAALIGAVPAVVVGGVGTLAVAALWAWAFPALRDRDKLVT